MKKLLAVSAVLLFILTSCSKDPVSKTGVPDITAPPPPIGFVVSGYFPSYRAVADVQDVKFRMCNVVNYAFFPVNASGTLDVPNAAHAQAVVAKAHNNNSKVMLSINESAAGNFKTMAATATGRTKFIRDVMSRLATFHFDGVDIDWEFPSTADGSDASFTALMKELSDSCHLNRRYYLTAAITAGKYAGSYRSAISNEVFAYVDYFNIMAYDDFTTDPAQRYRQHSDYNLASVCLNYWVNTRGMPASKALLGIPCYGRPSGITQSGTILTYRDILSRGGSPLSDSAVVNHATLGNYTVYYNGQPTVKKKTKLAQAMAGGVMFWEKGQDAHDNNSLLKAACDTIGKSY